MGKRSIAQQAAYDPLPTGVGIGHARDAWSVLEAAHVVMSEEEGTDQKLATEVHVDHRPTMHSALAIIRASLDCLRVMVIVTCCASQAVASLLE